MEDLAQQRTATVLAGERNAAATVAAIRATATRQALEAAYQQRTENTVYGVGIVMLLIVIAAAIYVGSKLALTLAAWANHSAPARARPA